MFLPLYFSALLLFQLILFHFSTLLHFYFLLFYFLRFYIFPFSLLLYTTLRLFYFLLFYCRLLDSCTFYFSALLPSYPSTFPLYSVISFVPTCWCRLGFNRVRVIPKRSGFGARFPHEGRRRRRRRRGRRRRGTKRQNLHTGEEKHTRRKRSVNFVLAGKQWEVFDTFRWMLWTSRSGRGRVQMHRGSFLHRNCMWKLLTPLYNRQGPQIGVIRGCYLASLLGIIHFWKAPPSPPKNTKQNNTINKN